MTEATAARKKHVPQRAKGENGLFEFELRGRTRWRAISSETIEYTDANGEKKSKRKTVTGTGDTAADAQRKLNLNLRKFYALSATQQAQNRRNPETVETYYFETFLKSKRAREWRTHVQRGVKQRIEQHVLPTLGKKALSSLQRDDIRNLFDVVLVEKGLSEATLVNVWRNFYTLLKDAIYDERMERHPMAAVRKEERPQKKKPEQFIIPPKLVSTVQQKVAGTDQEALRMVSLLLGLRSAELLGLTWDVVHLEDEMSMLEIRQQLKPIDIAHGDGCRRDMTTGKYICGKSGALCPHHVVKPAMQGLAIFPYVKTTPRNVTLVEPLITLLKKQKERQDEWRKLPTWEPVVRQKMNNLVFTTNTGKPLRQQAVGAEWKQLLLDCGFSELNQHKSRHIAITALILNNTPLSVIGSIVGHSDSRVTEQVYGQVHERDQREHLERLGRSYDKDAARREAETTERKWRESEAGRQVIADEVNAKKRAVTFQKETAVTRLSAQLLVDGKPEAVNGLQKAWREGWYEETCWRQATTFAKSIGYELVVTAEDFDMSAQFDEAAARITAELAGSGLPFARVAVSGEMGKDVIYPSRTDEEPL